MYAEDPTSTNNNPNWDIPATIVGPQFVQGEIQVHYGYGVIPHPGWWLAPPPEDLGDTTTRLLGKAELEPWPTPQGETAAFGTTEADVGPDKPDGAYVETRDSRVSVRHCESNSNHGDTRFTGADPRITNSLEEVSVGNTDDWSGNQVLDPSKERPGGVNKLLISTPPGTRLSDLSREELGGNNDQTSNTNDMIPQGRLSPVEQLAPSENKVTAGRNLSQGDNGERIEQCTSSYIFTGDPEQDEDEILAQQTIDKVLKDPPRNFKYVKGIMVRNTKRKPYQSKVHTAEATSLPYAKVQVTGPQGRGAVIYALIDSGSSVSLISTALLRKLKKLDHIETMEILRAAEITLADNQVTRADMEVVFLYVTMEDADGRQFQADILARGVTNLAGSLILGCDFLHGPHVRSIRKRYLEVLREEPRDILRIPIIKKSATKHAKLYLIRDYTLAPGARCALKATTPHPEKLSGWRPHELAITDSREELPDFDANTSQYFLATVTNPSRVDGHYTLIVTNTSDEDVKLPQAYYIANLGPIPQNAIRVNAYQLLMEWRTARDNLFLGQPSDRINAEVRANTATCQHPTIHEAREKNWRDGLDESIEYQEEKLQDPEGPLQRLSLSEQMTRDHSVDILEADADEVPLTDQQLLDGLPIAHLTEEQKVAALDLFRRHMPLLSRHSNDLYTTKLLKAHLTLKPFPDAIIQQPIKIAPAFKEKAIKILDTYIKYGILEECKRATLCTSSMFLIPKKNNDLRLLCDSRLLNLHLVSLTQPLQNQEDLFLQMRGAKLTSSLDLSSAFYCVGITKSSRDATAFIDPANRKLRYRVLAMGLKIAPYVLIELMRRALKGLEDNVVSYMDDIYIYTGDPPKGSTDSPVAYHFRVLNRVFNRLEICGMKLKPSKILLLHSAIEVLGFRFENGTHISVPELRVQGILQLQACSSPQQAKSLLGLLNFFRRMIPGYSAKALPIQQMANVPRGKFQWTMECQASLDALKTTFAERIKLRIPDSTKEFFIFTDASDHTISGLICQKNAEGNLELCCCVSHTLNKTERAYSMYKKEVIGVFMTLMNGQSFLKFSPHITLYCDAKALIYLRACRNANPMLQRISIFMGTFNLSIRHIYGEINHLSDCVSRLTNPGERQQDLEKAKYMTEKEAVELVDRMILPERFHELTPEMVRSLLKGGEGLPSPVQKVPKSARRLKTALTNEDMKGSVMPRRKIKIPAYHENRAQYRKYANRNRHATNTCVVAGDIRSSNAEEIPDHNANMYCCVTSVASLPCEHQTEPPLPEGGILDPGGALAVDLLTTTIKAGRISVDHFRMAQELDADCSKARDFLTRVPETRLYASRQGILFKLTKLGPRIYLPKSLLNPMLFLHHFTNTGLHRSATQMLRNIGATYYIPNLRKHLKKLTKGCFFCAYIKPIKAPQMPIGEMMVPTQPKEMWCMDILIALPETKQGHNFLLILVDAYSLFTILVPLKTKKSSEIVHKFKTRFLAIFGPQVRRVNTDADPSFLAGDFQEMLAENSVIHTRTAVASPNANSQAETKVGLAKELIKAQLYSNPQREWDEQLYAIQIAMNFSKTIYGFSPVELVFGCTDPDPHPFLLLAKEYESPEGYVREMRKTIDHITKRVNDARRVHNKKIRAFHNLRRKNKTFFEGQLVYMQDQLNRRHNAIQMVQLGPFRISRINPDGHTCWITSLDTSQGKERKMHFTHLRPMQDLEDTAQFMAVPQGFDSDIEALRQSLTQTDTATADTQEQTPAVTTNPDTGIGSNSTLEGTETAL